MTEQVLALVDCNNFYASCERAFNPKLDHQPVVVLSNNDGCIIARSNEAKALGFAMGDPYHLNKDKIRQHNVKVFSSNYALYGDMSRRVMSTLSAHALDVEIYSIDEAFLSLDGFDHRGLSNYAATIRASVKRATGIPVSIGIGPTKTLAKIANRLAKKLPGMEGVFNLFEADTDIMLGQVDVGDVWGVGRRWAAWLKGQGINTALDLKRADPKTIRARMTVVGERIVSELNGESCLDLELVAPPQKGITVSRSFGKTLSGLEPIREALLQFVGRAGEKLRGQNLQAKRLTVFLMTSPFDKDRPFYSNSMTRKLLFPSDYTPDLIDAAATILEKIYRPGHAYQKCGVMLTDLVPATSTRHDLFDERDRQRQARLMKALDAINSDHGARAIHFGNLGGARPQWATRAGFRSPRYTTRWGEIPQAR
ncbi:MAG: Y-family DNA polymerase [Nitrospiraceae bacterium]